AGHGPRDVPAPVVRQAADDAGPGRVVARDVPAVRHLEDRVLAAEHEDDGGERYHVLASLQSSPTPMSTPSGGSRSYAPHISERTSSRTALTSASGTSSSSSSWTWRSSR